MTGEHTVIGIVRVAVSDVVESIQSSWFHLESPSGTGFVGHHGEPTEIKLAFQSEVVPIVLSVCVRRAENLGLGRDLVDSFTRIAVAGQVRKLRVVHQHKCVCERESVCDSVYVCMCALLQVQDSRVVHQQKAPVYNANFDFNVFSEDLVKDMVVTIMQLQGDGKNAAAFIGQCRFKLIHLLESRASKDGWSTLMDKDLNPIPANGVDGSEGYARVWVTISCNLRSDDHQALSELGFSRDASGRVSLRSTAPGSLASGGSMSAPFSPSSAASRMGDQVSIAASIDSEGSTQQGDEDDDESTEGEFVEDDILGEPAAGSLDYRTWQTRATHASTSGSSRLTETKEEDDFLSFVGSTASSVSRSFVSAPSQGSSAPRSFLSSGARHRGPGANGRGEEALTSSSAAGVPEAKQISRASMVVGQGKEVQARTLTKGEEIEVINLRKKAD